jgi:hypothetical protein
MAVRDQLRCPQCGVPNDPGAMFCSRCGASQVRPGYTAKRRRRVSLPGFTMALACLVGLAVLVFVLYTIFTRVLTPSIAETTTSVYTGAAGTMATLSTTTTAPPSTTSTTAGVAKGSLLVRPSAATASSSLTPTSITDFRPTNLLDGDTSTAWVEGAKGTGTGQWVKLAFDQAISLVRLEVANGYQKDDEFFGNYVRAKSIKLQYSDGTSQTVQLQNEQGLQVIDATVNDGTPRETEWIKLTILSVYPTYKFSQAALSDVRVYEAVE